MDEDKLHKLIYEVIESELCISVEGIGVTDELSKLNVDTDDWSSLFIPALEKKLGIKLPVEKWSTIGTIEEISKLLRDYM